MGQNSAIEWCSHTFNPWRGCTKVSEACRHCYAEVNMSVKLHGITWGPKGDRIIKAESGWNEPLAWNRAAQAAGERHRVFCASLADVFEGPETMPLGYGGLIGNARARLFQLIMRTPHLDWLLLTKRPQNIMQQINEVFEGRLCIPNPWPLPNVWIGTSVENQQAADERVDHLRRVPSVVRFLSVEPLLGATKLNLDGIHLVIVGGESGPHARPMHPDWARSIRDQCQAEAVPCFFKQWGNWKPISEMPESEYSQLYRPNKAAKDGQDQIVLNEIYGQKCTVNTRQFQSDGDEGFGSGSMLMFNVGKHAGSMLDGRTWDEFPTTAGSAVKK